MEDKSMVWYGYIAFFFAGAFIANGVPHFVQGVSGKKFPTPFASPPGRGESSPMVNVVWGLVNFLIGYALLFGVEGFVLGLNRTGVTPALGALCTSIGLALYFGRGATKPGPPA
jgi:hypothetical protein